MCFSATASFAAGVVLTGLGAASLRKVKEPSQYAFAGIPLVFGVQQFVEGLLWLSLGNDSWEGFKVISTHSFLIIGQVVWPVWLPVAFILFEKEKKRKNIMKIFLGTGILVAAYFLYCLFAFNVDARVMHHHIFYDLQFPSHLIPIAAFFYVISVVAPPLISGNNKIKLIGMIILMFYVLSRILFQPNLISVWCFFAAVICILVYLIMRENARQRVISI